MFQISAYCCQFSESNSSALKVVSVKNENKNKIAISHFDSGKCDLLLHMAYEPPNFKHNSVLKYKFLHHTKIQSFAFGTTIDKLANLVAILILMSY